MTIRAWLKDAQNALPHLACFDLERLLAERLGLPRANLLAHLDDVLPEPELTQLEKDKNALATHQPLQYVLGYAWFMEERFEVNASVLIPRFDTETLVMTALDAALPENAHVLDLCTGSGIVAITLANRRPAWQLHASDISHDALQVAKRNAENLGAAVDFRQGDLFVPWKGELFDAILANPPYISSEEYAQLSPEVHKEPSLALLAENDGLAFYERLAAEARAYLTHEGMLAVEIGYRQGGAVCALFEKHHFKEVRCLTDAQGLDRVVVGHI